MLYEVITEFIIFKNDTINFEESVPDEITFSGNADWFQATDAVYSGTYSMKSGAISESQESVMNLSITTWDGKISFYKKISSEENYDS